MPPEKKERKINFTEINSPLQTLIIQADSNKK